MDRDLYLNNTMMFHATAPMMCSHCNWIIVIELNGIHDVDHYISIHLRSLPRDERRTHSDQAARVWITADARSEFDRTQYSCSLFIRVTTSLVLNVRCFSRLKKHKGLGLSPSTFLHFDPLDWNTVSNRFNYNETDITQKWHADRHTLCQIIPFQLFMQIWWQWLKRFE